MPRSLFNFLYFNSIIFQEIYFTFRVFVNSITHIFKFQLYILIFFRFIFSFHIFNLNKITKKQEADMIPPPTFHPCRSNKSINCLRIFFQTYPLQKQYPLPDNGCPYYREDYLPKPDTPLAPTLPTLPEYPQKKSFPYQDIPD